MACLPGFDGGMEQSFVITVTDRHTNEVVYNASIDSSGASTDAGDTNQRLFLSANGKSPWFWD